MPRGRRRLYQFLLAFAVVLAAGSLALAVGLHAHAPSQTTPPPLHVALATAATARGTAARRASTAGQFDPTPTGSHTATAQPASGGGPPGTSDGRPVSPEADAAPAWIDPAALSAAVEQVAQATGAQVGVAVRALSGSGATRAGSLQVGSGWSTMKVPVIMARYRLAAADEQSGTGFDSDVVNAITNSDNSAVQALFDQIEEARGGVVGASEYVQEELRAAGDDTTQVNTIVPPGGFSTFGQTQWSLSNGTLFYRALANGCLSPSSGARRVLELMGEITPSQSWGLGRTHFPGVSQVFFKGGWGPAPPAGSYTVRQFGIVETPSGHGFVVGIMTIAASGSFATGIDVLDRLAEAVAGATRASRAPAPTGC